MNELLLKTICKAIDDKKGENIKIIDIHALDGTICDHFVIASAESTVQVSAIVDNVEKETHEKINDKVIRIHGRENALWIAMDYGSVMVHIFQTDVRQYYRLEELWADGKITTYTEK